VINGAGRDQCRRIGEVRTLNGHLNSTPDPGLHGTDRMKEMGQRLKQDRADGPGAVECPPVGFHRNDGGRINRNY
jgi:hypothetical protein